MLSPYEFAEKTAAIAGIATMSGDKSKGKMIIKLSLLFKSGGLKLKGTFLSSTHVHLIAFIILLIKLIR